MNGGLVAVLGNRSYRRLFTAQAIALTGTGLLTVALGLLAFDLAGSEAGSVLGTALTIKMIAYVGVAPLAAAAAERLSPRAVLIGADTVRGLAALGLPFVDDVWQVYVLVFVLQCASATFTPTFQATIPAILADESQYTRALSLSRLAYDLEAIASPILAAALLSFVAFSDLFVGTAVGFAVSAVIVALTTVPPRAAVSPSSTFWGRTLAGVRVFARSRSLRFLLLMNLVVASGTALVLVNTVVYVKELLLLDDSALALTYAAFGAGSLGVALVVPVIIEKWGVTRPMLAGGATVVAALAGAAAFTAVAPRGDGAWACLLLVWALLGAGTSLISTPSARLLLAASTEQNRTLVYTAQFSLSHACFLLTYPLAGWTGAWMLSAAVAALLAIAVLGTLAAARASRPERAVGPPSEIR
ncbi:MFS transporter [Microbacterium sp.]|uniref:MFS transporter n=1 Tax=Microbacterium sp. TaxID=51671 RepID=UPI0025FEA56F|nr:MFS transporter [Microbacterium sp.]